MKLYLPSDKEDRTVAEGSPRELAEYMLTVEMYHNKNKTNEQKELINVLLNSIVNSEQKPETDSAGRCDDAIARQNTQNESEGA